MPATTYIPSTVPTKTAAALHVFLFLLLCPLILVFAGPLTKTVSAQTGPLLVGAITSALTFALTLLFVRWDRLRLRDVGAALSNRTAPHLLLGLAIGATLVAVQDLAIYSGEHAHWGIDSSHSSLPGILLAFAGYGALALREELAFRGYPLRRLDQTWGMWPSLIVVTIVFTLEHAAGGWTWSRTLLGPPAGALLFGMAALATRGLAMPLGIHAAFNFAQWIMGQKETPGPFRLTVDPGFTAHAETIGYAAYLTGTLIAASAFWWWHTRRVPR